MTAPAARAGAEFGLACAAVLGCAASWSHVRSTVAVEPIVAGEPAGTSVSYDPQLLFLALLLAACAGVLGVIGSARLYRTVRERRAPG